MFDAANAAVALRFANSVATATPSAGTSPFRTTKPVQPIVWNLFAINRRLKNKKARANLIRPS